MSSTGRSTSLLAAQLAALVLVACRAGGGAGAVEGPVPRAERDDGGIAVCVVDAQTGRPIEGATLSVVPERHTPMAREWWQAAACTSDRDGVARLALPELAGDPWLIVRAKGYAPRAELTRDPGPRLALERAAELEVEVRDVFERPVEGANVSWFVGCGHTPDVAWALTDAEGRARLTGVSRDPSAGDLWVAGPTLATDYGYAPEAGSALVRVPPGVAARGRVVDAAGAPLAGVYVGAPVRHHGPWSRTDGEGRFELPGIDAPVEVQVLREPDSKAWLGAYEIPDDGREVTLVAPLDEQREPATAVELSLRSREGLAPLAGVPVEFVRLADGLTHRRRSDDEGLVALALPAGTWQRRVAGGFSGWQLVEARVEVGEAPLAEALTLDGQPRWRLSLKQEHPDARVELASERDVLALDAEQRAGAPVAVPREGRCVVRVEVHDRVAVTTLDSLARRERGELELALPAPLQIRARLVDATGAMVRGVLWVGRGDPPAWPEGLEGASEVPRVSTWKVDADLWVLPAEPRFEPRRLARALPWEETRLELGDVVLESTGARRVTLVDAGGAPLAGAEVWHFAALGRGFATVGDDGVYDAPAFPAAAGDRLVVRPGEGAPSFHAVLAGSGPWTVARPDTRAVFEVVDPDGLPLVDFRVVVAGEVFEGRDGRLELDGLDPGRHVAFVEADGHMAWREPLEVAEGGRIERRVVLPAR